jgi:hypothetical protein
MLYRLEHVLGMTYANERQEDGSYRRVAAGRKDSLSTVEVRNALKLSDPVIRRWLADPHFREYGVAEVVDGRWVWDRYKTIQWVIAVMKLDPGELPARKETENPPARDVPFVTLGMDWKRCRKAMGMEIDHTFKSHR